MKNLFRLVCGLLFCSLLKAQGSYHPMLVDGRSWDIFEVPTEQSICAYESAGHYFLQGDSMLEGLIYKKLYYNRIRSSPEFPFCTGFYRDTTTAYFSGLLREDTFSRKVYRWNSNQIPGDELLYDFSLQAGDTLYYPSQFYPILSVTDWVLTNGEHRKAFEIGGWPSNYYVEGLGYLMGQFGPVFYPFEGWRTISCMRDGEEAVFSDGGAGCISATSSLQNIVNQGFEIYPNPFSNYLILKMPQVHTRPVMLLELIDLTGRVVFQSTIKPESATGLVDLPPLPQGVYGWALDGILQGKLIKM